MRADSGLKFDRARIDRVLALSLELTDLELTRVIQELQKMKAERDKKVSSENIDTIST